MPTAACQPPPARIAPAQRAAHVTTGTLHGHAACSQRRRPHTASRSKRLAGVPPERCATHRQRPRRARPSCSQAPRERRTRHGLCFSPKGQARCANCLETALVPRLPAPCRVATQGLPASARLPGSAHCQPGCFATLARHCPPPLPCSSHGSLRVWLPFGPARFARHPATGAVSGREGVCARPLASIALRA